MNLRNRPGGLARIKTRDGGGAEVLNGRYVTTVEVDAEGFWLITPSQDYTVTRKTHGLTGQTYKPGDIVNIDRVIDSALIPVPDTGITKSEVDKLYAPTPQLIPLKVLGEVSAE